MIGEEMTNSTKAPEEYLDDLGLTLPTLKFLDSAFARAELERIHEGRAQVAVDMTRYKVEPPPEEERDSLEAWQRAVDNAHSQLQMTKTRMVNLELMNKYGANAWKTHAENIQKMQTGMEEKIKECAQEIENVNRKRKTGQAQVGDKLRFLENKWGRAVQKTNELEGVCVLLEREVKRLKKRAEKRGLKVAGAAMDTAED